MKIFKFILDGAPRFGVLEDSSVLRLLVGSPFDGQIVPGEKTVALAGLRLLAPTVDHPRVFGVGFNYKSHILETKRPMPEIPPLFMKPDTSLMGHGGEIVYPKGSEIVHYESELVIVMGKQARNVRREHAHHYVLGYACGNAVSERTVQRKEMAMGLMTIGKAYDTFAPVGPCVETEVDPSKLKMIGRLNGKVVQESDTSDLLFGCGELVEYISRAVTLMPGDLIMTGTPGGVGPLQPGDVFSVEIEGIGTLSNPVVSEVER